jgi:AraC family transcriptional regulator
MADEDSPIPFRLDDQPAFEDIGVKVTGHVVSPRGVELVAVKGSHIESELHEMTSAGWLLHTFITPPKGSLRIDSGKEAPLPRFVFLPPGVPIQWRSSPSVTAVCHFGPDFMTGLLEAEPRLGLDAVNCLVTKGTERLNYLAQQAFTESLSPGFGATLFAEAIGMEIALEIVRYDRARYHEEMQLRGGLAPWQMRRLDSYVREHLSEDLSLQRLAALLGMSERHLSRVIKREKGVSVHRWIADLRLDETRRLLMDTRLPLHEIARRVAFKSLGAFSTAFRAACGLPPSEYRRLTLK